MSGGIIELDQEEKWVFIDELAEVANESQLANPPLASA